MLFGGENIQGERTTDFFSVDLEAKIWTRVPIEDGSFQDYDDVITIFRMDRLFLFGIHEDRPNTFSIAQGDADGVWTWKCLEEILPPALHNVVKIYASPLSHANKLLLVGCSKKVRFSYYYDISRTSVTNWQIYTAYGN